MVFFTCNHCGEACKKNAVEKHQYKCRGRSIFVSCIDCLKDFNENYVEHIKCITEDEKYSGKDYVAKPNQNKGEKKQKQWLEVVRDIIVAKATSLDPAIRSILNKLESYDNVPRKQAKFKNFLKNSLRVNNYQADIVWNLLEEETKRNAPPAAPVPVVAAVPVVNPPETNGKKSHDEPKSKKRKLDIEENGHEEETNGHAEENGNDIKEFNWEEKILKILRKKSRINQEKLKTKILKKYLQFKGQVEITPKNSKKFIKKLKSIDNVKIEDEYVLLNEDN